jgi:hypothetical protein
VRIRCGGIETAVDQTRIARFRVDESAAEAKQLDEADEAATGVTMQRASPLERWLAECGALRALTCDTPTRIERYRALLERCAFMVARARAPSAQLVSAVTPLVASTGGIGSEWRAARALEATDTIGSALAPLAGTYRHCWMSLLFEIRRLILL